MEKIVFRADGNNKIGLGHIYRSLALAQILSKDFKCIFVTKCEDSEIFVPFANAGITVLQNKSLGNNLNEEIEYISQLGDIIVLDGYHFSSEYQAALKYHKKKLVCIDDIHANHFYADILINHSISATREQYSLEKYTQTYFGLKYALLRNSFNNYSKNRTVEKVIQRENENVLICLGGADPQNYTLQILQKLSSGNLTTANYHVVLGPAYQFKDEIEKYIERSKLKIFLHQNLSEDEMFNLMISCKSAICSASSVAIEYLSIGGMLYVIIAADNQREFYQKLTDDKLAFDFDSFPVTDNDSFLKVVQNQINLIDGLQDCRFLEIFKSIANEG